MSTKNGWLVLGRWRFTLLFRDRWMRRHPYRHPMTWRIASYSRSAAWLWFVVNVEPVK